MNDDIYSDLVDRLLEQDQTMVELSRGVPKGIEEVSGILHRLQAEGYASFRYEQARTAAIWYLTDSGRERAAEVRKE